MATKKVDGSKIKLADKENELKSYEVIDEGGAMITPLSRNVAKGAVVELHPDAEETRLMLKNNTIVEVGGEPNPVVQSKVHDGVPVDEIDGLPIDDKARQEKLDSEEGKAANSAEVL